MFSNHSAPCPLYLAIVVSFFFQISVTDRVLVVLPVLSWNMHSNKVISWLHDSERICACTDIICHDW